MLARYTQHMLSLAAGALLATAFMHLLPEAFESQAGAHDCSSPCWWGWCSSSCWTRPSCGTTGTNTTTRQAAAAPHHHAHEHPQSHAHGHMTHRPTITTMPMRAAAGQLGRADR
jgi:zinc and cadmium transporter